VAALLTVRLYYGRLVFLQQDHDVKYAIKTGLATAAVAAPALLKGRG